MGIYAIMCREKENYSHLKKTLDGTNPSYITIDSIERVNKKKEEHATFLLLS